MKTEIQDTAKAILRGKFIAIQVYCKKQEKSQINNMLLNQWITGEIKEEIKKYLETNENDNMMTQNQWDAAKQF